MNTSLAVQAFEIGLREALKLFASLRGNEVPKQVAESALAVVEAVAKAAQGKGAR